MLHIGLYFLENTIVKTAISYEKNEKVWKKCENKKCESKKSKV